MPPPPPPPGAPPPPGPPPPSFSAPVSKGGGGERKDLLKQIQKGAQLKKTVTNDRSGPILGTNKNSNTGAPVSRGVAQNTSQDAGPAPGPLPGIGGLFAGGMPALKKTVGGVKTGRSNGVGGGTPQNKWGSQNRLEKPPLSSSSSSLVKDIESKIRQRSFLHSNSSSVEENPPISLTRTKSSGCVTNQSQSPSGSLPKSKSSTFISPDQSEALMYNTKVTLTLRRSNSQLNSSSRDLNSSADKNTGRLNGIHRPNGTRNGGPSNFYYFGSSPAPAPPPASSKPSLLRTNSSPSDSPSPSPTTHNPAQGLKPAAAPPPPPSSSSKPYVPNSKPSFSPRQTQGQPPSHPSMRPPPPPSSSQDPPPPPRNPPNRNSKSFSQARPANTIGPGPQSRTPLPMQGVSRDDSSIQNGKLSRPPPPPVRTVSRGAPPPPPGSKRPSQPPPPPPSHGRPSRDLPPPPPPSHHQPPAAPQRKESLARPGTQNTGESFETKFAGKFRSMQYLPPPELFSRCQKTYPSKSQAPVVRTASQVKRTQAPPPPPPGKPPLPPGPPPPTSKHWATATVS